MRSDLACGGADMDNEEVYSSGRGTLINEAWALPTPMSTIRDPYPDDPSKRTRDAFGHYRHYDRYYESC